MPSLKKKRVLDIGCGFGWHCAYAAEQGAEFVLGIDISEKMLAVARQKTKFPNVVYSRMAMEDLSFPEDTFDVVISSLAFHYAPDFADICARVARCLAVDGDFIFSVEHPIFTAHGTQDWIYSPDGSRSHWPVDHYFSEGKRAPLFLGERVTKYHKTIATYLNALLQTGFAIAGLIEPKPAAHLLDTNPEMRDELRRPMMLLISAKRT